MNTSAEVLADSVSPGGVRLTTLLCVYPRFIHSEMLRHRVFSHSVASSRAIPTEKLIEQVRKDPFVPTTFNKRVKGMGVGEVMDEAAQDLCRLAWTSAAEAAADYATTLNGLGIDKSRANRLLEPFLYVSDIITATEWDNFFELRDHEAAQPEFRELAILMRMAVKESTPVKVQEGEWHLPLVTYEEKVEISRLSRAAQRGATLDSRDGYEWATQRYKMASASRCARISFDKHTDSEPIENTIARAQRMLDSRPLHASPFEHVARPVTQEDVDAWTPHPHEEFIRNFRGWVQMRAEVEEQVAP